MFPPHTSACVFSNISQRSYWCQLASSLCLSQCLLITHLEQGLSALRDDLITQAEIYKLAQELKALDLPQNCDLEPKGHIHTRPAVCPLPWLCVSAAAAPQRRGEGVCLCQHLTAAAAAARHPGLPAEGRRPLPGPHAAGPQLGCAWDGGGCPPVSSGLRLALQWGTPGVVKNIYY